MYKILVSFEGETGKHGHNTRRGTSYKSLYWAVRVAKKIFSQENVRAVVIVVKDATGGEKPGTVKGYANKTTGVSQW